MQKSRFLACFRALGHLLALVFKFPSAVVHRYKVNKAYDKWLRDCYNRGKREFDRPCNQKYNFLNLNENGKESPPEFPCR